jgi:hypothetical protein
MESTNNHVRERAVVLHGATYVSEAFIRKNGRLGRSLGCTAVPMDVVERLVQQLKNKSVLLVYGQQQGATTATTNPDGASTDAR